MAGRGDIARRVGLELPPSDPAAGLILNGVNGSDLDGNLFPLEEATLTDWQEFWIQVIAEDGPLALVSDFATSGLVGGGNITVQDSVIPVPAAFWLFGSALGLLGWMRRRQS